MSSHNIAKSAVKPIFSPLPHPTFFAPKSPFFPLFPVLDSISSTFSRNRSRFLPCEAHFFLVFPRFGSDFGRFFDGTSLFSAPNFNFSSLSGTSSRELTLYYRHTSLFAQREYFSDSGFPFLHPLPHLPISIDFLSALHSPLPLHYSPTFFLIPPHFSIFLPNKRTIVRTLAHCARTRTPAHTRTSGGFRFFSFTASPTPRNPLCTNALGVKKNEKKPSPKTQLPQNQYIKTKHPISSAVNFISSPR